MSAPVIAIDGPSGAGKGTVSAAVAGQLGFHFLDSGAVYRLLGLAAREAGVATDDGPALAALAGRLELRFDFRSEGAQSVWLDGRAVGEAIRTQEVARAASRLAALPEVRAALLALQRDFRRPPGLVADGRDMGTVVFPDAACKIFLDASCEERARRRYKQLKAKGKDVTFPLLLNETVERDRRDRMRAVAPLAAAPDAVVVDTTDLSIDAAIGRVLEIVHERLGR